MRTTLISSTLALAFVLTAFVGLVPTAEASHSSCSIVFTAPAASSDWRGVGANRVTFTWHTGSGTFCLPARHEVRSTFFTGTLQGCALARTCNLVADVPEGTHTIESRAVALSTTPWVKSAVVKVDLSAPEITLVSPGANSLVADNFTVAPCDGNGKVKDGDEVIAEGAEVPVVEGPEAPESVTVEDPAGLGVSVGPIDVPAAPASAQGPDACNGRVAKVSAGQQLVLLTPEQLMELDPTLPASTTVEPVAVDERMSGFLVVAGTVTLKADVQDALSGTAIVELLVDGVVVDTAGPGNGIYTFAWDTSSFAAGDHTVSIRATDFATPTNVGMLSFTAFVSSAVLPEQETPAVPELP